MDRIEILRRFLLVALVLPHMALAADSAALTPEQTKAVNQLIHDYLMNNPKVFAEALAHAEDEAKSAEAAETSKAIETNRSQLYADPTAPVLGDPAGDVTLVEFFDYRCPYCKASAPIIDQLLQSDKHLRIVMKEFPILGDDSVFASKVSLVAARHGRYAEVHEALLTFKGKPTPDDALTIAKSAGLDPKQVKQEMASPEIDAAIKRNMALADTLKIDGTPTFVIGSTELAGVTTLDDLRAAIAAARKAKS